MVSPISKLLVIIGSILVVYGLLCFVVHYLDFGWNAITGKWLHEDFKLVKRIRLGIFHKVLICLIMTIIIYGGLSQLLGFLPQDWGWVDKGGKFHPYKRSLISILSIVLSLINMYAFGTADTFFKQRLKPTEDQL
jgi:hypothetical protein